MGYTNLQKFESAASEIRTQDLPIIDSTLYPLS